METITSLEKQRAHDLAEEYRKKGYHVIEEPSPDQLPDFLSSYRPDLLAQKGQTGVVVEVKSRASLAKNPKIRDLARLLQTKPDWDFELVVVKEPASLSTPEGILPFARDDILREIQAAEKLLTSGAAEAALLLAWPALEATVRLLTQAEGIVLGRLTPSPSAVLDQAVSNGAISRSDYTFLMDILKHRNAFVHGFKSTHFDSTLTKNLISTTERLIEEASSPDVS